MNKFLKINKAPVIPELKSETESDLKDEYTIFIEQINFLIYLKNPWKLINNCPSETFNCLNRLNEINFKNTNTFDYLTEEKKNDLIEILIDYVKYMNENLHELFQKSGTKSTSSKHSEKQVIYDGLLQTKFEILYKFSLIMWTWADKSVDFCIKIHEWKFIRVIFKFLNDSNFVSAILSRLTSNDLYLKLALTYKSFVGLVHNLSKYEHLYPDQWKDTNCFNCLLKLTNDFNNLQFLEIRILAYFALINLVDNKLQNLDKLLELKLVVEEVMYLVNKCSTKIVLEEAGLRKVYKIENEGLKEIAVISSKEILWRLTELLNFLMRVVDLNDKFKYDIYEGLNGKCYFSRVLFHGNLFEKEYVLKLLWKLCMDKFVANLVRNDLGLYSFILGLSKNQFNKNKSLLKYSNYILFLLNSNNSLMTNHSDKFLRNNSFSVKNCYGNNLFNNSGYHHNQIKNKIFTEEDTTF
ncbi:unnamed protein product [Brachionus calyciflorus]|uniref:Ataxin-10 domain-containing protein n=1 Tax=Brachionus calyciflorus TaxID=104777 RepID=A0A813QRP3_9BILA|nr:unnamed protein product [Brachionus calyciflorus]